ncbi:XRE family transcriptional regulator [Actinacidiphila sp. ITFR-21]|uniref:XRE family transcriptional regulator n=1 Tax=Actinacidiphila sp. ITFR-21 TaxID=3075199 RepID=UPI00288B421A|nr:XRE family transcriptional regulator [Streptomyces sp. ITFR-21]WNI14101.1 XRE family transcriptional regulator [Streptomyces sp. ITFR-21]
MTGASMAPQSPEAEPPSRRGRKPGPISDTAGVSHRAWLEPVRTKLSASGLTLNDLVVRSGYSKTRISELLRGNGYYPGWELTYSVIHALDIPTWPMQRLWTEAAREAHREADWIERSIRQVYPDGPRVPPLEHEGFKETVREPYTDFARVFLQVHERAVLVVRETFDILWVRWDDALASDNVPRYAWNVLRERVMARTPQHADGRPDLRPAAFSTVAQDRADDPEAHLAQVSESLELFDAISRLPHNQLDVTVLQYMCGMDTDKAAEVLGVSPALAGAFEHHARGTLEGIRSSHPTDSGGSTR